MRHAQPATRPSEQKTRVVHCMEEPYDVYIGRGRCPKTGVRGPWGNPFSHLSGTLAKYKVATRDEAVDRYEDYVLEHPELLARLHELKGRTLGCWCKHKRSPKRCHGDVLARLADALS